jgi:hypothetical protein
MRDSSANSATRATGLSVDWAALLLALLLAALVRLSLVGSIPW